MREKNSILLGFEKDAKERSVKKAKKFKVLEMISS